MDGLASSFCGGVHPNNFNQGSNHVIKQLRDEVAHEKWLAAAALNQLRKQTSEFKLLQDKFVTSESGKVQAEDQLLEIKMDVEKLTNEGEQAKRREYSMTREMKAKEICIVQMKEALIDSDEVQLKLQQQLGRKDLMISKLQAVAIKSEAILRKQAQDICCKEDEITTLSKQISANDAIQKEQCRSSTTGRI